VLPPGELLVAYDPRAIGRLCCKCCGDSRNGFCNLATN